MAFVTLGTFRFDPETAITFGYDYDTLLRSFYTSYDTSTELPTYFEGDYLSDYCSSTTRITWYYTALEPYSYNTTEENSPTCGYVPEVCDLLFPLPPVVTNETSEAANDGTVTSFASTSAPPVTYVLDGADSNTTGYFIGIAPGEHTIKATDDRGCTATATFTIYAFDSSLTRYKYRLRFKTVLTGIEYELRFLDQKNQYNADVYPIDLTGTDSPIIKKQTNSDEDKTTAICPSSIRINLLYNGHDFLVSEFANAAERDWKIELYEDGGLDWQGWLLPDEIQDLYADPKYPLQFIATDGLLSLKGATFADLSIYNIYTTGIRAYSPILGLRKWVYLMRICMEQLGYDYGTTTLVSSLIYQSYNSSQWLNYSTWADLFYDNDNNPVSVYDALTILLKGLHLQMFQHKGAFVMWDINDVVYRNSDLLSTEFAQSVVQFNKEFTTVELGTPPVNSVVGYNKINRPINPQQTLNYDKAYNRLEAKIQFNLLAVLYTNPSFEINSVVGQIPDGFNASHGGVSEYGLINTDAFDGKWSWKIGYNTFTTYPNSKDRFIENNAPFFNIDQPRKTAKISFMWKPSSETFNTFGTDWGVTFSFVPVFIDSTSGKAYFLKTPNYRPYNLFQVGVSGLPDFNPVSQNVWADLDGDYDNEWWDGDAVSIKGYPTRDYTGWQSFSIDTGAFPDSGIGTLSIRIYGAAFMPFIQPDFLPLPYEDKAPYFFATQNYGYYLIDNLNITLGDAADPYNRQIGESHTIKNVTEYAKAEKKQIELSLFTYPVNKRIAGNFMYGDDYDTTGLSNEWKFRLSTEQIPSRLPTNVIKRIAKNYQRPMYKWQGDVLSDAINYYMVFSIEGLEQKAFIAFTIEKDLRNSVINMVLIEVDDTATQDGYLYTPLFEKSARNNIT